MLLNLLSSTLPILIMYSGRKFCCGVLVCFRVCVVLSSQKEVESVSFSFTVYKCFGSISSNPSVNIW